jgi:hypothetical protein
MLFDLSPYINGNAALAALVNLAIAAICAFAKKDS